MRPTQAFAILVVLLASLPAASAASARSCVDVPPGFVCEKVEERVAGVVEDVEDATVPEFPGYPPLPEPFDPGVPTLPGAPGAPGVPRQVSEVLDDPEALVCERIPPQVPAAARQLALQTMRSLGLTSAADEVERSMDRVFGSMPVCRSKF